MTNTYSFDEIKEYIVGKCVADDYFGFTMYSHEAPKKGDKITINGDLYVVESITDATTREEKDEGLSFSCVRMQKI